MHLVQADASLQSPHRRVCGSADRLSQDMYCVRCCLLSPEELVLKPTSSMLRERLSVETQPLGTANSTADRIPVFPPPPGVESNWVNPENQTTAMIATHTICLFFVTAALAMRLYTKRYIRGKLGLDDYCCLLSWVFTITFSALHLSADKNGLGHHVWDIELKNLEKAMQPAGIAVFFYNLVQMTVKLTCLLFYRHLFHPTHKTLFFVHAGIALIIVAYSTMFFLAVFQCWPVQRAWNMAVEGTCYIDSAPLAYSSGAVNTLSDIYILLVPIPAIMALPLGLARKLRIIGVFALGMFACATSLIRIVLLVSQRNLTDFTWHMSIIGMWSTLEVDVGLICACLFVLPAFLKHHRKAIARLWPAWLTSRATRVDDSYAGRSKPTTDQSSWREYRSPEMSLIGMEGQVYGSSLVSSQALSSSVGTETGDEEAGFGHNRTKPLMEGEGA